MVIDFSQVSIVIHFSFSDFNARNESRNEIITSTNGTKITKRIGKIISRVNR